MARLQGKHAVITGAARGIGEAIARAFHAEGASLMLTDINDAGVIALADTLGASALKLDVASESDWDRLSEICPQTDIVINNAGVTGFENDPVAHDPEHASLQAWRDVHAVNTDGTFLGCRYAIRAMRPRNAGAIVNISSRSGLVGIPGAAAYAASKAAIRNHTKTVALYCAQQGLDIRCNSVHPAAILTPMWEPMLGDPDTREATMAALVKDTPMQRFGTPEEVAALALLLASDEARYITGSEMTIDGGLLAGSAATPG
ncbi:SDR family oxidoreductase [Algimonas porphyrae]|uniref:Short-chain dehydrogenase n=1 Tax=Algimonas porphyrae TaxID=1128113 RepID=A0ABQ5V3P8_9PROT|nr:SDR family oxidoreductase [Algimonas porphyrae]GLQ21700.1 short-chain dehydrogenase [Algimonas porphyrae]